MTPRILIIKEHEAMLVARGLMRLDEATLIVRLDRPNNMDRTCARIRSQRRKAGAPVRWWLRRAKIAARWLLWGVVA